MALILRPAVRFHQMRLRSTFQSLLAVGKARLRTLGWVNYCQRSPHRLYMTISRTRDKKGKWQRWYLVSNCLLSVERMPDEYGRRFSCEEGFLDSKW